MYWKYTQDPNGNWIDDFGKRYYITSVSDEEYSVLLNKEGFFKHWSQERFIELAGLREV
ncbi:MAG: hypothetical protein WCR96_03805 [Candidatus Methanomethylophilaceae archaeon]